MLYTDSNIWRQQTGPYLVQINNNNSRLQLIKIKIEDIFYRYVVLLKETITDCQYIDSKINDNSLSDNQKAHENGAIYLAKNKPPATQRYDLLTAAAIVSPDSLDSVEHTCEVVKGF